MEYKTDSKTETETYYYGNGLIYESSSEVGILVYHYNHLGSTTAVTDKDGKLVYNYDYGTYGELASTIEYSTIKPVVRFLYNGQLGVATDDNTLYYMRSRYYNPDIKRFINQDVLIGSIGSSNSLNRYSYVEGNPVSYTDPFGLSPFSYLDVFDPSAILHTTLDVLGCLPGGSIFDLANAALYFLEDNDVEGWKSLCFAIPGMDLIGKGAKWGAKIGGKAGKLVEETMKALDFVGHLGSIFFSANDFGNDIAFMIDKYMVGEAEFSSDTIWELASLGAHGFQLKSFSDSFLSNVKAGKYDSLFPGMSKANIDMNDIVDKLSKIGGLDNRGSLILPFGPKGDLDSNLLNQIPKAYKVNYKCMEYADELEKMMIEKNIGGTRIHIKSHTGNVWSLKHGNISTNGNHDAIKIGDIVYDNLNPTGIKYDDWLEDLGIIEQRTQFSISKKEIN